MSPFGLKFSQMILHTETSKLMYNWSFLFEVLHKPTLLPSTFNAAVTPSSTPPKAIFATWIGTWLSRRQLRGLCPRPPWMYKGAHASSDFLGERGYILAVCLGKIFARKTWKGGVLNQSSKIWGFFSEASREIKKRGYDLYVHISEERG